jgi:fructoselysine-6-P-deglycase FrlB-like protein
VGSRVVDVIILVIFLISSLALFFKLHSISISLAGSEKRLHEAADSLSKEAVNFRKEMKKDKNGGKSG